MLSGCTAGLGNTNPNPFFKAFNDNSTSELRTILEEWKYSEGNRDTANLTPIEREALEVFKLGYFSKPQDSATMAYPFFLVQDSIRYCIGHETIEEESWWSYAQRHKSLHASEPRERNRTHHWIYDSPIRSVLIPSAVTPPNTLHTGGKYYSYLNMFLWGNPEGYTLARPPGWVPDGIRRKRGAFVTQLLARLGYSEPSLTNEVVIVMFDSTLRTAHFNLTYGTGSIFDQLVATKDSSWKIVAKEGSWIVD